MTRRGQTNAAGLALLILLVVLALGALTAGIGSVIHTGATTVETERVADELGEALNPVSGTSGNMTVEVGTGTVTTEQRSIRLVDKESTGFDPGNQTVEIIDQQPATAVQYSINDRRATVFGSGVFLTDQDDSDLYQRPHLIVDDDPEGILIIGIPHIEADQTVLAGPDKTTLNMQTAVDYNRQKVDHQQFYLGIETQHPQAWEQYLKELDATVVTTSAHFDDDQHESVIVTFNGSRTVEIIDYTIDLEVLEE